jgi:hypothetical protein
MSYSISRAEPASTSIDVHAESAPCPNLSLTACHVDAVASADARLTESGAPDAPVRTPRAQPSDPGGGVALCTWRRVIAVAALVLSGCTGADYAFLGGLTVGISLGAVLTGVVLWVLERGEP